MNKISIIVPTYNCEKYIKRCLDSIIPQLHKDDQLIVINDCSKDSTIDILKEQYDDDRICIIDKKINEGVSRARNDGIEKAKNDLILFIDGDDYISSDYLDFIRNVDKNCSMITGLIYVNDLTKEESTLLPEMSKSKINNFYHLDVRGLFYSACNKTYSRDILLKNNIRFNETAKMMEDYEFNLNYYKFAKKVEIFEKAFYYYSYHGSNSASSKFQKKLFERYKEIKIIRNTFYNKKIKSEYIEQLNINFLLICINNLYKKESNNLQRSDRIKILNEIFNLNEFKAWKKQKKVGINEKVISFACTLNNPTFSDAIFKLLHFIKNNFNFVNKIFRKLNKKGL